MKVSLVLKKFFEEIRDRTTGDVACGQHTPESALLSHVNILIQLSTNSKSGNLSVAQSSWNFVRTYQLQNEPRLINEILQSMAPPLKFKVIHDLAKMLDYEHKLDGPKGEFLKRGRNCYG